MLGMNSSSTATASTSKVNQASTDLLTEHRQHNISYSDRLKLVSSLYGPGAIGCWLCITLSVIVSWTLNKKTRRNDTITNDFIAALTLPAVAAGHLIYLIATYPGDRSDILTTQDPRLVPRVAAIEAALNVCETFATLALSLFVTAAFKVHVKRCIAIGVVGLLCFGSESTLFFLSPDSSIRRSNFTRPFLLDEHRAMMPIVIITSVSSIAAVIVWIRGPITEMRRKQAEQHRDGAINRPPNAVQRRQHGNTLVDERLLNRIARNQEDIDRERARASAVRTLTFLSLGQTLLSTFAAASVTALGALHNFAWRLRFFIPETSYHITDLDQAVALVGGAATLAFSCVDAIKDYVGGDESSNDT